METDKICKQIADAIRNGFFYAGAHSGFRSASADDVEKGLKELVSALKRDINKPDAPQRPPNVGTAASAINGTKQVYKHREGERVYLFGQVVDPDNPWPEPIDPGNITTHNLGSRYLKAIYDAKEYMELVCDDRGEWNDYERTEEVIEILEELLEKYNFDGDE